MSVRLPETLSAWGTSRLAEVFKREAATLDVAALPLQQALTHGSHVLEQGLEFVLLEAHSDEAGVRLRAGVFFQSVVAGCSCADDPSPVPPLTEYCELLFHIRRPDGDTRIALL